MKNGGGGVVRHRLLMFWERSSSSQCPGRSLSCPNPKILRRGKLPPPWKLLQ